MTDYRILFERGEHGLQSVARDAAIIVIVDVCSFSTAVDIAVTAGAFVKAAKDGADAGAEAERYRAFLAVPRSERSNARPFSLSPDSLAGLTPGDRLILPSPNGATLVARSQEFRARYVIAACLRNASAVAAFVSDKAEGAIVAVIASGERRSDGSLRAALEDDVGAGAILSSLDLGRASPEAIYAAHGFLSVRDRLAATIAESTSGRELIRSGYASDVERAAEYDVSVAIPIVREDGFLGDASRSF